MINEKIQNLLKELQKECEKEGVSGICTLNKKSNVVNMLIGNLPDVAFCLAVQERQFDEGLPIPTRILRDAGLKAMEVTDKESKKEDISEFSNIFDQIFGGKEK